MKPFTEEMRYEYDLSKGSTVLDFGGFRGEWTERIKDRYDCTVHVFEPVRRFYDQVVKRVGGRDRVFVHPWAIGAAVGSAQFSIKGDMTGAWADNPEFEQVMTKDMASIFAHLGITGCDLMKLNVEGGEFSALEQMIEHELIRDVDNIQVQWHPVVPFCEERYKALQENLAATHRLTFDAGWVWQNWAIER